MSATVYTGNVRFEAAALADSMHTGTVVLEESTGLDPGYLPGAEISTGAFVLTSPLAYAVNGLTIGDWYCLESYDGYWRLRILWPLVMSVFRVSDGSGLAGSIGQYVLGDRITVADGTDYPAWCAFAECFDSAVDGNRYGRVYFQAPAITVYTGMISDSSYADNTGTTRWRLRHANYTPAARVHTGAVTLEG